MLNYQRVHEVCWSAHLGGASALSMCAIDSMRPGLQRYGDAWCVRVRTKGWPPQLIHVNRYVHHVDPYQFQSIKIYEIISDALNSLLIILNRWLICLCENGSAPCDCLCMLLWLITISRENVRSLPVSYSAIQSYAMYSASDIFWLWCAVFVETSCALLSRWTCHDLKHAGHSDAWSHRCSAPSLPWMQFHC